MKNTTKKLLALLVAFILCFGVCQAAFDAVGPQIADKIISAIDTGNADEEEKYESPVSSDKYYSREELEAFADKAGGDKTHEEIIEMSDKELGDYIEENLKDTDFSDIVNAVDPTDKESVEQNREALEEIADILGCDTEEIENMDNSELLEFVEDKIESESKDKEDAPVVNLDKKEDNTPVADIVDGAEAPDINDIVAPSENEEDERNDNYNENGELNGTFDELYPELMETEEVEYDDETVLVKLPADFDGKITKEMKSAGVKALELLFALDEYAWYEAFVKKGTDIDSTVAALREIEDVLLVEYNFTVKTTAMANYEECDESVSGNKFLNQQWHLNYCGIAQGNRYLTNPGGSPNVIVAVIDTGVDINHEDLKDNIYVNENEIPDNGRDDDKNGYIDDYYGVNIITGIGNGNDDNGHGTHVAGIIAAQNNNLGTVGIAYNTKIMPIKAAQSSGTLNQSDIAKAIYYAYEHGAEVINMSFGGVTCSAAVQDALKVAYSRCVLVASAGNDGKFNEELDTALPNYPAALSYVLGVMSVGRTGVESSFSSYDKTAYSGLEYEVYAPGEEIISTVPGNKYASWSGTSMAAPMVSAIAALIRSQFNDKNTYSTKFIYGQLTSTSSDRAVCIGHADHGIGAYCHHVPFIINLIQALKNLPKPQLGMSDYYIFDTAGFESDTENHNNGDGVVDAGETIALGLILRNKWGSSENTIVSIDCTTVEGYDERYVEIVNPSVSYGRVGTYMSKDCGKLYEDEVFTGWEEPFYIKISKDCPNEYKFNVNVTIRCENGIDFLDDNVYTTTAQLTITVRNGYVLPSIIEEDMTLTPDNLYIIPNSTTIKSGVTVRVEPGTRIQFWSNDASDPYADDYIAFLRVEGNFIAEGTAENPVYIYPSKLMKDYIVEIDEAGEGYVSISHADVTNLFNSTISNLSDSIFRKSTSGDIYYRYISSGKVYSSSTSAYIYLNAKNTVFYKINGSWGGTASAQGTYDSCLFLDCAMKYNSARLRNCVLYGNTYNDKNSSYTLQSVYASGVSASDVKTYYVPETGTTYLSLRSSNNSTDMVEYLKKLGYSYAVFETEAELDGVNSACVFTADSYNLGIEKRNGAYYWSDGTAIGDFIDASSPTNSKPPLYLSSKYLYNYSSSYYLFEIKGDIYATDISFSEFDVAIDLETEYQINAITAPIPFEASELIFESKDESVATVDKNGLVTPVAKGKTEIYVYSKDKAVYNYIDVSVVDYVALEDFDFRNPPAEIEVGTSCNLVFDFSPVNTTRKNVKFSSSAPEIISVNASGIITANARGEAVITAELEGITKEITVTAYKKTSGITLNVPDEVVYYLSDKTAELPIVSYCYADVKLVWTSADEDVVSFENGKIMLNSSGAAKIRVTDERTGLYSETLVYVASGSKKASIVKIEGGDYLNYAYALTAGGDIIRLSDGVTVYTDVKDICCYNNCWIIIKNSDEILYGYDSNSGNKITTLKNVKRVACGIDTYFAITEDGVAYAWGGNYNNCSGTGVADRISEPVMVNLENVCDIYSGSHSNYYFAYFLCSDGSLYYAGGNEEQSLPVFIKDNVTLIDKNGSNYYPYALVDGLWYQMHYDGSLYYASSANHDNDGKTPGFAIIDGVPYDVYNDAYGTPLYSIIADGRINNAVDIIGVCGYYGYSKNIFIICSDGSVYGYGSGFSSTVSQSKPKLLPVFSYNKASLALEEINLEKKAIPGSAYANVLKADSLVLDFNGAITSASGVLKADGVQVPFRVSVDFDKATYTLSNGFKEGVIYELTVPVQNASSPYLSSLEEAIVIEFVYKDTFVREISFSEEKILIVTEYEYQLSPVSAPFLCVSSDFYYVSSDESVATVDENGLITPVAKGSAFIWVYSADKKVSSYIRVNVVDYVALNDFSLINAPAEIEVGTSYNLACAFTPADTTRKNVTFTSSNPEIISVSSSGVMTAKSRGETVITAELEGITKEITVYSYKKAESISMNANSEIVLCLSDKTAALPEIIHGDSDVRITWTSTDESVLSVKNGRIKLNSSGVAILRATDERTGFNAEIKIYVTSDSKLPAKVIKIDGNSSLEYTYALTEDGKVIRMSDGEICFTDVKDIDCKYDYFVLLKNNGEILYGNSYGDYNYWNEATKEYEVRYFFNYKTITSLKNVKKVIAGNDTYFAITEDGFAYSWGYNYGNCSGTGIIGTVSEPALVNLENVCDIYSTNGERQTTYFLCSDGSLYCVGDNVGETLPVLIKENVTAIDKTGYSNECLALIDGKWYHMNSDGRLESAGYYYDTDGRNPGFTVIDGIPYHLQDSYKYRIGNIINAVDVIGVYNNTYIICEDGSVFAYGYYVTGTSREKPALLPLFNYSKKSLALESTSLENGTVLKNDSLVLDFNGKITAAAGVLYADGVQVPFRVAVDLDKAVYTPVNGFREGVSYEMTIPASNVSSPYLSSMKSEIRLQFTYEPVISEEPSTEEITTEEVITEEETTEELIPELPSLEEETTEAASEEATTVAPEIEETEPEKVTFREAMLDESVERYYATVDEFVEKINYLYDTFNPYFYGNVILNRISTDFDGDNWLRIIARESSTYEENPVGYNYWGTTNETAIGLQLVDFTDFQIYQKLEYKPFLETAPENVFPFITDVKIFNEDGEEVKTAGNEEITVRVTFNRDMDVSIPLSVRFGDIDDSMAGSVLKVDYTVTGDYVDARTWEGSIYLSTLMNNGNHYFTIANGKAKDADLYFYEDAYRFGLEIDTTAAQALIMQGTATDEGVELSWSQDDFDTLMGYNVYRSESEDGYYKKLNSSVIPDDTKTFFDDTVEPGKVYYYNFTVVKTDLTESTPSGKISIISKDTMAPDIYHTPVYSAKTGANLIISATVSDNLGINNSVVYYRTTGDTEWKMAVMNNLNDKYSVIISADEISLEGFEYYIEAFDGINYTYKGSAENPYVVSVQQSLDDDALGDVNGDGKISNIDALMLLQAINDMLNLTEEQFERADLDGDGELAAVEALRILHYVSGSVGSVKM